jgi:hypothetical protein
LIDISIFAFDSLINRRILILAFSLPGTVTFNASDNSDFLLLELPPTSYDISIFSFSSVHLIRIMIYFFLSYFSSILIQPLVLQLIFVSLLLIYQLIGEFYLCFDQHLRMEYLVHWGTLVYQPLVS